MCLLLAAWHDFSDMLLYVCGVVVLLFAVGVGAYVYGNVNFEINKST